MPLAALLRQKGDREKIAIDERNLVYTEAIISREA